MLRFFLQTFLVGLIVQLVAVVAFKASPSALLKSRPLRHSTVAGLRITPTTVGISKSPFFLMPPQHEPQPGDAEKKGALLKQNSDSVAKVFAVTVLSAFLWSSPLITSQPHDRHIRFGLDKNIAIAKEMASGSGSRVNKDPESLLRYGLPIDNQEVGGFKIIQSFVFWVCLLIDMLPYFHCFAYSISCFLPDCLNLQR